MDTAWDSILNGMYLLIGVVLGAGLLCGAALGLWMLWEWLVSLTYPRNGL